MESDPYDLRCVEQRLTAMKAARTRRRQAARRVELGGGSPVFDRRVGGSQASGTDVTARAAAPDFDVLDAVSSSDDSDSSSDDETMAGRRDAGLKDSLELSMSMSMSVADEPTLTCRRDTGRGASATAVQWLEAANTVTCSFVAPREVDEGILTLKETCPVTSGEDKCASTLVQRRRQLEQEARQRSSTVSQRSGSSNQRLASPTRTKPEECIAVSVPIGADLVVSKQDASADANATGAASEDTSCRGSGHSTSRSGIPRRVTTTGATLAFLPQAESLSVDAPKMSAPVSHSSKPLTSAIAMRIGAHHSVASAVKVDFVEPVAVHDLGARVASRNASQENSKRSTLRYAASYLPERRSAARGLDNQQLERSLDGEDAATLSEEERLLRESLERLDHRLTALSVRPPAQNATQGPVPASYQSTLRGVAASSGSTSVVTAPPTADSNNDDDVVRAASYGGGVHCRSGVMAPAATRASSSRRAELSSGVPKSRVRVGRAFAHDAAPLRGGGESDGQHKVTVKKNLAHLLFQ